MDILIIEDTKALAASLKDLVNEMGYNAELAYDGRIGFDKAEGKLYDAIILDIMLPKMDGFTILKNIRHDGIQTPVLVLTARSGIDDRINGLNLGADYYLPKPFDNREFVACLKSILRRPNFQDSDQLIYGDLILDSTMSLLSTKTESIQLNPKELEMMRLLMLNVNHSLSKDTFINKVWGYDSDASYNSVEAYISFLRRKLEYLHSSVAITIIRKAGYHLTQKEAHD